MDDKQVGEYWEGNAEVWAALSQLGYNVSRDEITIMSFMDIPDLDGALREAYRVLQPGGFLQLGITHPCVDMPLRGWLRDESGHKVAYQFAATPISPGPASCPSG
jgi:ubiquinone/menaquinone biosynthesis C-methylase UbiE